MSFVGTVINGVIVLEGGTQLPEGARVFVELEDDGDLDAPAEPYDRETELAILRESIAEAKAGPGMPLTEFVGKLEKLYKSTPPSPK